MIRKFSFLQYFFGAAVALSLASCGDEPPQPQPEPEPEPPGRTVLVYQVANNNLGQPGTTYDRLDIEEMLEASGAGDIPAGSHLLVYNAGYRSDPVLMEVTSGGLDTILTYDRSMPSVDSRRMLAVLADMETLRPNPQYGLVLWSHGTGWVQDGMADVLDDSRRRSFGNDAGKTMNVTTLAATLERGPELAWIYFDCCFMASVETLYEMRRTAPLIVASPTELRVEGMPYHLNVKHFFADGNADLLAAARSTFEYYDLGFTGSGRTCTMTVADTRFLDALARTTAAIYAASPVAVTDGYEPQRYENLRQSCKYFDFADYVRDLCVDAAGNPRFEGAAALMAEFDEAFARVVLYAAATPKLWNAVPLQRATGLSTYILNKPSDADTKNYSTLSWYADVASKLHK